MIFAQKRSQRANPPQHNNECLPGRKLLRNCWILSASFFSLSLVKNGYVGKRWGAKRKRICKKGRFFSLIPSSPVSVEWICKSRSVKERRPQRDGSYSLDIRVQNTPPYFEDVKLKPPRQIYLFWKSSFFYVSDPFLHHSYTFPKCWENRELFHSFFMWIALSAVP